MRLVLTGPVIRRRLALCMAVFFALFTALSARLFYLQVISAEDLQRRAQAQWTSESTIRPTRGMLLDRNGKVLAQSATAYTACVSPRQVADPAEFAEILSPVLDMDRDVIEERDAEAADFPGNRATAQIHDGGIFRRRLGCHRRAVFGRGKQAILSHGRICQSADWAHHH